MLRLTGGENLRQAIAKAMRWMLGTGDCPDIKEEMRRILYDMTAETMQMDRDRLMHRSHG